MVGPGLPQTTSRPFATGYRGARHVSVAFSDEDDTCGSYALSLLSALATVRCPHLVLNPLGPSGCRIFSPVLKAHQRQVQATSRIYLSVHLYSWKDSGTGGWWVQPHPSLPAWPLGSPPLPLPPAGSLLPST